MHNENVALMNRLHKRRSINTETGCWEWLGAKTVKGYGFIKIGGHNFRVHRVMAMLVGDLEDIGDKESIVRHTCDNPSCFNPEHLLVGTTEDNFQDCFDRNRWERITKLSREDVRDIRIYYSDGATQKELSLKYDVSQPQISRIVTGKKWNRLDSDSD
jgi:hypothetical protein